MSAIDLVNTLWRSLDIHRRKILLLKLAVAIQRQPGWWDNKSCAELAVIDDGDELPSDLFGNLILAWTEEGFDVDECARCRKLMQG